MSLQQRLDACSSLEQIVLGLALSNVRRVVRGFARAARVNPSTPLGQPAIHEQLRARDVAAVVGCEKHHGRGGLLGGAEPRGTLVAIIVRRRCPRAASRTSEELSGPKVVRDSRHQA